ncbi:MAG TPA: gephyrin-like molybdotransferase Glp [Dongiaceae bacterium]|jgi:molybdopterin molybdotransferase|nr:gephyrin-like molybdotransferase Glp [Dongiaceae bacterium]
MLSVEEATARILAAFAPLGAEVVALDRALGRTLARPVTARLDHPPQAVSAMDGYAVRAADVAALPARLRIVETIAAGSLPTRAIGAGEASRIFTGGALPQGADAIVIQENTEKDGDHVRIVDGGPAVKGKHVRPAGNDFAKDAVGVEAGRRLTASDIGLAAAMNWPWLDVTRRPRVAIISTGNELAHPGEALAPGQIVASNGIALSAFVTAHGGEPVNLGIARDEPAALGDLIDRAQGADLLLTSGGASVGEHDLVQGVLKSKGMDLGFWKIAMRPGKPLMFGRLGASKVIGLPGNPVSALVTATLFVGPAIARMLGRSELGPRIVRARLGIDLPANDLRQDYLRSKVVETPDGPVATPFGKQDSAMLSALSRSGGLVIREPHAPAIAAGSMVDLVRLD